MFVCSCLNAGLTAARINLIFGTQNHIGSDCAIGYMILTFEVIKGHFRSNKFLCMVLLVAIGESSTVAEETEAVGEYLAVAEK